MRKAVRKGSDGRRLEKKPNTQSSRVGYNTDVLPDMLDTHAGF